jgi:hypothetical protein
MSGHILKQRGSNHEVTSQGADGCHNKLFLVAALLQCVQVSARCLTFFKVEEGSFFVKLLCEKIIVPRATKTSLFP